MKQAASYTLTMVNGVKMNFRPALAARPVAAWDGARFHGARDQTEI